MARANAPAAASWNSAATQSREDGSSLQEELFPLAGHLEALRPGENVLAIHGQLKDITSRWLSKDIDSTIVIKEMAPVLQEMEETAQAAQEILAGEYNIDVDELAEIRQEIIDTVPDLFATPTPEPDA